MMKDGMRLRKRNAGEAAIIEVAWQLVQAGEPFTMRGVASAADVSVVTCYNYFGSKRGLMAALLMRSVERRTAAAPEEDASHTLGRVRALAAHLVASVIEDGNVYRAAARLALGEKGREVAVFDQDLEPWIAALRDLAPPPHVRLDHRVVASHLANVHRGAIIMWLGGEFGERRFRLQVEHGAILTLLGLLVGDERAEAEALIIALGAQLSLGGDMGVSGSPVGAKSSRSTKRPAKPRCN